MKNLKSTFKVAGVQFCGKIGQWEENLARMEHSVKKAVQQKCDLILFPETSLTGFVAGRKKLIKTALRVPGEAFAKLLQLAKKMKIAVSIGFPEKAGQHFYISQATALPDNRLHLYRKRFGGEKGYTQGKKTEPFSYRGLKIGIAICMDARIFELYREYAFQGVDLILKPNNAWAGPWREDKKPDFRRKAKEHEFKMRMDWLKDSHFASSNGMAMIAANAVGYDGETWQPGGCWFSAGTPGVIRYIPICCEKAKLKEKMLVGEIDIGKLRLFRKTWLFKHDLEMARKVILSRGQDLHETEKKKRMRACLSL